MPDKDTMRRMAMELVGQIASWGGQGKDVAEFLGVSPTTISHWRRFGELEKRKPAIPTDDQLLKLMAILLFRIGQNLGRISALLEFGSLEPRYQALLAGELAADLGAYSKQFEDQSKSFKKGFDKLFESLKAIQDSGGATALQTILNPVAKWGSERPNLDEIREADRPLDLDSIRVHFESNTQMNEKIQQYVLEFRTMIIGHAREVLIQPRPKNKKGRKKLK